MITITCVYKTGPKFDISYVDKMYNRLKGICSYPFEFVCLTDSNEAINNRGYTTVPLKFGLEGWWSKMELFDSSIFNTDYVLYFDLDTLFIRDIYEIIQVAQSYDFFMLRGFNPVNLMKGDVAASGIMSWKVGSEIPNKIYSKFFKNPSENIKRTKQNKARAGQKGDQGFIGNLLGWKSIKKFQENLPKNYIASKKQMRNRYKYATESATIVAWSGSPALHKVVDAEKYKWVKRIW